MSNMDHKKTNNHHKLNYTFSILKLLDHDEKFIHLLV